MTPPQPGGPGPDGPQPSKNTTSRLKRLRQRVGRRRIRRWWGGLSEPRRVLAVWALVLAAAVSAGLWASHRGDVEVPEVPFRDVAVGGNHACGLHADGRVACWGLNRIRQAQYPEGTFRAIAASGGKSCGLRVDGSVQCWTPSHPMHEGPFTAVSLGPWGNFCALRPDGTLECWGSLVPGGDRESDPPPGRFLDVSVGKSQTCGIRADGELECWDEASDLPEGRFSAVSAGLDYACGLRTDQTVVCWGKKERQRKRQILQEHGGSFSAVAAGEYHACGLRTDQTLDCWRNDWTLDSHDPMSLWFFEELVGLADPPGGEFIAVSVTRLRSCAVRTSGAVVCWGQNPILDDDGNPLHVQTNFGQFDAPAGQFIAVSAGGSHACGLRADNTIDCWGYNSHGQADPPGGEFISVAAGEHHSCGLRATGRIQCWGTNREGQMEVPDWKFTAIAAGSLHTCGLRDDGEIRCWGYGGNPFSTISARGNDFACGRRPDGAGDCWPLTDEPSDVPGDVEFIALAARRDRTCGMRSDGAVRCWGRRQERNPPSPECELEGDGALSCWRRPEPDLSAPPGPIRSVSVGNGYACGILTDDTLACWADETPLKLATPEGVHWQCTVKWWSWRRWISPFNTC